MTPVKRIFLGLTCSCLMVITALIAVLIALVLWGDVGWFPSPSPQASFSASFAPSFASSPLPSEDWGRPEMSGDAECLDQTTTSLDRLEQEAPTFFDLVITSVGVIDCQDQGSGMYSWEDPPRYQAGAATRAAGTVWYAASIVHDACHSRQYQRAWAAAGSQPDPTVLYGRESEAECLAVQHDALVKLNASPEEIKTVDTALETAYWDVPYADRWW